MTWNSRILMSSDELHRFFLRESYNTAHELSDDPKTKVGAVIFAKENSGYRMISRGANILLPYVERYEDGPSLRLLDLAPLLADSVWKKDHMQHGEHSVIENVLNLGRDTKGTYMAMPWAPCLPCGKRIRLAGIDTLIMHKQLVEQTPESWRASTEEALDYLLEHDVNLVMYDGRIGEVQHLFNGQLHYP